MVPKKGPSQDYAFRRVEAAFSAYFDARDASGSLDHPDIEELCASHPDLASDLKVLDSVYALGRGAARANPFLSSAKEWVEDVGAEPISLAAGTEAPAQDRRAACTMEARYVFLGELAREGDVIIHRVLDRDLDRAVVMKVLDPGGTRDGGSPDDGSVHGGPGGRSAPRPDALAIARFFQEARIAARLDHPAVLPVHEVGVDPAGRFYFTQSHTQSIVQAQSLEACLDLVRGEKDGWSLRRAVEVLVRVCQAAAYAHSKGIIHCALSPANILVGSLGEVYITGWGLASFQGEPSGLDAPPPPDENVDPSQDVAALGAMLHALCALNARAPAELAAVARMAASPAKGGRYASALAMAADLQAFLDHREVHAHDSGATAQLKKWMARNRGAAGGLAAALLVVLAGSIGGIAIQLHKSAGLAQRVEDLGKASEGRERELAAARESKVLAEDRLSQVLKLSGLSDLVQLRSLRGEAEGLWPCVPGKVPAMEAWIRSAREVAERLGEHEASLENLESSALAYEPDAMARDRATHPAAAGLVALKERLQSVERQLQILKPDEGLRDGAPTILSFGPDPERKPEPYYFRREFRLDGALPSTRLKLRIRINGGGFVYLNSKEVWRFNLGGAKWNHAGPSREDGDLVAERTLDGGWLRPGLNVVAAEINLHSMSDEDLSFALELSSQDRVLVPMDSEWSYLDAGKQPGSPWAGVDQGDSAWPSGPAPLGFGFKEGLGRFRELETSRRALEAEASSLEDDVSRRRTWPFVDSKGELRHAVLSELLPELRLFSSPGGPIAGIEKRLAAVREVERRSLEEPRAAWEAVLCSIANADECPQYRGLRMEPQFGLVPLGRDPASGFWEFAHAATGEPPRRDERGKLVLTEAMGLVFVLVPGGRFRMGAVPPSPAAPPGCPNVDPDAQPTEAPVHEVELDAFFISKFEMTQGQWLRVAGRNPSEYGPTYRQGDRWNTLLNPVERISWEDCREVLGRLGLEFPTEAQWEHTARGGTTTAWWTGIERESLRGAENLGDVNLSLAWKAEKWTVLEWLDDGYARHAPVGTFRANAFGLHDVAGNVMELCRDDYSNYKVPALPGTGLREQGNGEVHVLRGGGWLSGAIPWTSGRSTERNGARPNQRDAFGVRPARRIAR